MTPAIGLPLVLGALASGSIPTYAFVLPLVIAMSVVYSTSRYEALGKIAVQSARLSLMILGILTVAMVVLLAINTQV